jgi:hypothetical protein
MHTSRDFKFGKVFKVLWLDQKGQESSSYDRNDSGTGLEQQEYCKQYQEPLASKELCEELSKTVAKAFLKSDL